MSRIILALFLFSITSAQLAQSENIRWLSVKIGIVGPGSVNVLQSAFELATKNKNDGLIIILDTPGGSLDSTREMVKNIMSSRIPVAVWVGPNGARAGSAGAFLTLSGNFSAMAPGTNIGASHPIQSDGTDVPTGELAKKVENDTVAFIESIAKARGRNAEVAASFVLLSSSITASEALENKIIDVIAESPQEFLDKIDGKTWELEGTKVSANTKGSSIDEYQYTLGQKFLQIVSNPNLFYLLFLAGIIGLGFELTHPGVIFPGVFGAICLTIALISSSALPISAGAAVLVICGIGFMIGEIFLPSFGVLGIGGIIAFVAGSILLVDPNDTHGLRISLWMIIPSAVTVTAIAVGLAVLLVRSSKQRVDSGPNSLLGKTAEVLGVEKNGELSVRVSGEIWSARLSQPAQVFAGQRVEIERIDGMCLWVKAQQ